MITRVWIEPGCIVCKLCEETCPEVFDVTPTDCVVRPDADLTRAERIKHATEECPVSVIRFEEGP
ncbi:MAG: ferredoxin [Planctomycetes bacterium]|nr:ferredoxin [Planctomycetota bacterium]